MRPSGADQRRRGVWERRPQRPSGRRSRPAGHREPPLADSIRRFRVADGCPEAPDVATGPRWSNSPGTVRTVTVAVVDGAGHQWPGARPPGPAGRAIGLDVPSTALDATTYLWERLRSATNR